MEAYLGSGGVAPLNNNLGAKLGRMVGNTPRSRLPCSILWQSELVPKFEIALLVPIQPPPSAYIKCQLQWVTPFPFSSPAHSKQSTSRHVILYDIFVSCSWVDTRWQYTFTHEQYIEQHN
jgi:hypothetical protein